MWNWVTSSDLIVAQMAFGLVDGQKNQVVVFLEQKIRERSVGQEPAILEVAVNIQIGEK